MDDCYGLSNVARSWYGKSSRELGYAEIDNIPTGSTRALERASAFRFTHFPNRKGELDMVKSFRITFRYFFSDIRTKGYVLSYNHGGLGVRLEQDGQKLIFILPPRGATDEENVHVIRPSNVRVIRPKEWNSIDLIYNFRFGQAVLKVNRATKASKAVGQMNVATTGDVRILEAKGTAMACLRFSSEAENTRQYTCAPGMFMAYGF